MESSKILGKVDLRANGNGGKLHQHHSNDCGGVMKYKSTADIPAPRTRKRSSLFPGGFGIRINKKTTEVTEWEDEDTKPYGEDYVYVRDTIPAPAEENY